MGDGLRVVVARDEVAEARDDAVRFRIHFTVDATSDDLHVCTNEEDCQFGMTRSVDDSSSLTWETVADVDDPVAGHEDHDQRNGSFIAAHTAERLHNDT